MKKCFPLILLYFKSCWKVTISDHKALEYSDLVEVSGKTMLLFTIPELDTQINNTDVLKKVSDNIQLHSEID